MGKNNSASFNEESKKPSVLLVIEDEFASSYGRIKKEVGDNVRIVGNGERNVSDDEILDAMKEMQGENKDNPVHVIISQHGAEKLRESKGDYKQHNTTERISKMCEQGAASVDLFSCYGGTLFENDELAARGAENNPPITVSANRKNTAPTIESDLEIIDTIKDITEGKSLAQRRIDSVMRDTETKYYSRGDKNTGPKVSKENYDQEKEVITDDEKLKSDIKRRVEHAAKSSNEPLESDLVTSKKKEVDEYSKDDVNAYRKKVFQTASWRGNSERVKASLEVEGVIDVNEKGKDGMTAIHRAALENHSDVLDILLSQEGADVNAKNDKDLTPLHFAAEAGSVDAARKLIEKGADVNSQDSNLKNTPLHYASKSAGNTMEITDVLLEAGADIDIKNAIRETPKETAQRRGNVGVQLRIEGAEEARRYEAKQSSPASEIPQFTFEMPNFEQSVLNQPTVDIDDLSIGADSFLANLEAEMKELEFNPKKSTPVRVENGHDVVKDTSNIRPKAKEHIEKNSSKMRDVSSQEKAAKPIGTQNLGKESGRER
ncbi:MAG: ankyrin repeat domain-containing protein [Rickettsiales bacterium]|nr:ankyrin repeat domain-containing protein [Pseudomonadota bacterium]MDA0967582.1 ankyrin repeat domain-containing protein [Pseudomonadota bacterium]MDG4544389.1 ankyrin repeat domain-containing protein [Rickettsiales bacterium]MDG4546519.1 ankyrin repeat domain-containing protein [Rickettsiales bacterium]MDG4548645.1 ankyrin repeat domain-containing protein [Rickettsiales bacterium]